MYRAAVAGALLLLLLALGVCSAGASATKLTLSEGGIALAPGANVYAEGGAISVYTSKGPIECEFQPELEMFLSVVTNSRTKDELKINSWRENQETCRSFTGNSEILLQGLGSFVRVGGDGSSTLGPRPTLDLFFEHIEYQDTKYEDVECVYRREQLHGTNTATATRQALQIDFEGTLTLRPSESGFNFEPARPATIRHLCPSDAELSISLPLQEGETAVVEEQTSM